jgi:hypothetical protein
MLSVGFEQHASINQNLHQEEVKDLKLKHSEEMEQLNATHTQKMTRL